MSTARISIYELTDRDLFSWAFRHHWFWMVSMHGRGWKAGYASTLAKARTKAEKAARSLGQTRARRSEDYNFTP